MAAIAERVPASVTADGEHTVRELVEHREPGSAARHRPREGADQDHASTAPPRSSFAKQGWELDAVPPAGAWVKLALTGNMSTGGTSIDRTVEAHPENVEIAETAARVVGLDVAGIDFIVPDIAVPVREQGGAIVEVNAAPGFRMHTHPTDGRAAVRGQAGHRPALPAGHRRAHPDHRRDRHQRQDDDGAHDRPHPQAHGPARRA